MSFDVFLVPLVHGEVPDADRQAILAVLKMQTYRGPDDLGFYRVTFSDGRGVQLHASGLESGESFTGCSFAIRSFSDGLMPFMFDVATAGNLAIFAAAEAMPAIVVSEEHEARLDPDIRRDFGTKVVRSAEELRAMLCGGYDHWSAYRDQVLAAPAEKPGLLRRMGDWLRRVLHG